MRSSLPLVAGFLVLVLGAATARADVTETFVAVDEVSVQLEVNPSTNKAHVALSGVLLGQSSTTTRTYGTTSAYGSADMLARCEKLMLLAQARPGRYRLAIVRFDSPNSDGTYLARSCRLIRVN